MVKVLKIVIVLLLWGHPLFAVYFLRVLLRNAIRLRSAYVIGWIRKCLEIFGNLWNIP